MYKEAPNITNINISNKPYNKIFLEIEDNIHSQITFEIKERMQDEV